MPGEGQSTRMSGTRGLSRWFAGFRSFLHDAPALALTILILIGICCRAWILFCTPQMPGMNGAYSLVQTRSLLDRGILGLPDFPLAFMLQAALALLIQLVTGLERETAIVIAVKSCLAFFPPFAAIPVFLLGRKWGARAGRPCSVVTFLTAAMVSFRAPAMSMTGEFDKNALALVWLSGMLLALHTCMERTSFVAVISPALCLVLLGLTHVGAFGAGLVLAASICAVYVSRPGAPRWWSMALTVAAVLMVVAATEGLVFWKFDPERIERLLAAIANPLTLVSGHVGLKHPMPAGARSVSFFVGLGRMAILGAVAAFIFKVTRQQRREHSNADVSLVWGSVLGIMLITGPWVQGDATMRLMLIAALPAMVVGMFVLLHIRQSRARNAVIVFACLVILAPGIGQAAAGGRRILDSGAYTEMGSLSAQIPQPGRTLIVAMHGVEWNAAWTLHTHIAQASALHEEDWKHYDDVLFLVSKDRDGFPGPPGHPGPPRPFGPPGPPEHFRPAHAPEAGPRPPMMFAPVQIPSNALILHDGPHFKLARVATPPPFVKDRK